MAVGFFFQILGATSNLVFRVSSPAPAGFSFHFDLASVTDPETHERQVLSPLLFTLACH